MAFNKRERHLLARSLFRFNVFLADQFDKAHEKRDEEESRKNLKIMQEVTALHDKLGLTNEDLYELSFDGTKYDYRFKEQTQWLLNFRTYKDLKEAEYIYKEV